MKKSLVLAMAMALGVTASAYAANPFSDVPAGHWAYDSVAKLAAAGVVEGYGDTTFGGDKLMTRYEMAQIVAKAMARGANVDRLAAEFADELDTLGVRVANLEKKADNVTITGQVRARYVGAHEGASKADLRTRLWVNGQVNDDWSYTAMLQNIQTLSHDDKGNKGDDDVDLNRAYLNGKLGGLAVTAGRWDEVVANGTVVDSYVDGVKVAYGDKVKVFGVAAKGTDDGTTITEKAADRLYVAGLEAKVGAVNGFFNYTKAEVATPEDKEVFDLGVSVDVAKDLNLSYEYNWGNKQFNKEVSKDGYVVGLSYKGADAAVAGSYGIHANYYDQPVNAFLTPTYDAETFAANGGYKGWSVGTDVTLAKNIQLSVNYYDTEAKDNSNQDEKLVYSELFFFF